MSIRCAATVKATGEQCRRWSIDGGTVCIMHGGSAPQVKAAARRRLLEAVDPVIARLVDIALHEQDPKTALVALRDVLDRVGVSEPKQIEIVTLDAVEQEIARLEAELAALDTDAVET